MDTLTPDRESHLSPSVHIQMVMLLSSFCNIILLAKRVHKAIMLVCNSVKLIFFGVTPNKAIYGHSSNKVLHLLLLLKGKTKNCSILDMSITIILKIILTKVDGGVHTTTIKTTEANQNIKGSISEQFDIETQPIKIHHLNYKVSA